MSVHGYITHAARNRRFTGWLFLGYVLAFELIGAFALTMILLLVDEDHTILSNPGGYAIRYALPVAALAGLIFWSLYQGHARRVTQMLGVRIVTRREEPRFHQIAEEQCTALGVRLPRFGVIEASEPNAVTVGEGPNRGLIAVTRGLLDTLDDDELAAILAHEASHIRQGDTKLLAANHALMRTAILLQTHNPLRIEDWRQMILLVLMPPILLVMLAGGAATMFSMTLARTARRGLKLSRDHTADGEAIRVTHFPEALISALQKIGGRGAFERSYMVEGLLFDGPADHEGGTHPAIKDRIAAIGTLGRAMMDPNRRRRDTRVHAPAPVRGFGRRAPAGIRATAFASDKSGRPLEQPPTPTLAMTLLYFTDRDAYREWQNACIAWYEWRIDDKRNFLGLTPKMIIPVAATCMFLLVFHWPADGSLSKLRNIFSPSVLVDIAHEVHSGPFCSGPSYPDGKCDSTAQTTQPEAKPAAPVVQDRPLVPEREPWLPPQTVPFMLMLLVGLAIFKPKALRQLFGVVDAKDRSEKSRWR